MKIKVSKSLLFYWLMGNKHQVQEEQEINEKKLIIQKLESKEIKFADIPLKFRRDITVAQFAVDLDPYSIFMVDELIITEDLAFKAVTSAGFNNEVFNRLPDSFKKNREFVKRLLPRTPSVLLQCFYEFKMDKELIKLAMIGNNRIYESVPPELITEEFLLELFPLNPSMIYTKLSEKVRLDQDIALKYMNSAQTLNLVPMSLLKNSDFLVKCFIKIPSMVKQIPCDKEILSDDDLFQIVKTNPEICHVIKMNKNDLKNYLKSLDLQNILSWEQNIFKNEALMVRLAFFRSEFLKFFDFEFNDREMILKIIQNDGWGFQYLSNEFKNDPEIAFEAVYSCPSSFLSISQQFKEDQQFVTKVLQQNGLLIQYCSNEVKNNYKLVELAMNQNKKAFHHISKQLQSNKFLILINEVRLF
jgi:hypothetical protein